MKRGFKKQDRKRDAGGFLALPFSVIDSQAYLGLSPSAVKLLFDIAGQYRGYNNGKLYAAWVLMSKRGWQSQTTLTKAKNELLASQLLFETRKGARPNKAAWYAITWMALDHQIGMDVAGSAFQKGAYWHLKITSPTPETGAVSSS